MEKAASASGKRGAEQPKQAAPKVVHISNPMRLEASASNFRSIVQELTGQHAVWPVDPSKFSASSPRIHQTPPSNDDLSDKGKHFINGTAADPSPVDVVSPDLCFQPLDHADDRVVLIDHHMLHYMLHDHQDFAGFAPSKS